MENMQAVKDVAEKLNNKFMGEGVSEKELNLDAVKLVESLGGTVYEVGYIKMNGNSMVVNPDDNSFEIYVSAFDGKKRQKFTIAHEIGHYFIHYLRNISKNPQTTYRRTSVAVGGYQEYEANVFAANLLMPESKFKQIYENCGQDLAIVAEKFGVSIAAAEVRARSLGLIGNV